MEDCGKYYFDGGLRLGRICPGDEAGTLRSLETLFGVRLVSRENWVEISGDSDAVARMEAFFSELTKLFLLQKNHLERRDFEFLCRSFRTRREADLPELWKERIEVSPKKREVMPRSGRQMQYVRQMRKNDLVFGIGPAGTGKTYLAMAMAVSAFLKGEVGRIVLTRPARESGENLGFLPGSLEEKILPYLRPLYDALYDMMSVDEAKALMERDVIEVAPLAFMRGRTLNNAFIILDEAQNCTCDQMLMFLTRMGFHSKCVVTGDPTQSDLTARERSGLERAMARLRGIPGIEFCFFQTEDVVRHALLEKIIGAYTAPDTEKTTEK